MTDIKNGEIKHILVFGASITYGSNDWAVGGWVVRLKNYFATTGQFKHVFNLAISGQNSNQILDRMELEMMPRLSEKPDKKSLVIIGLPTNDTRNKENIDGNPELTEKEFKENLKKFHEIAKGKADELVFVGVTKVDESKTTPWREVAERRIVSWKNNLLEKYNQIAKDFCEENKIYFIEMIDLLEDSDLPDGLHPNEAGHQKMFERIKDFLTEKSLIT